MFAVLKSTFPSSYLPKKSIYKPFFYVKKNTQQIVFNRKKSSNSKEHDRSYFLKKIGLDEKSICWPERAKDDVKADYWNQNPCNIKGMYGSSDLSKLPVFHGGYINFGFWPNSNNPIFGTIDRTKASELLYQKTAEMAGLDKESVVVDVGCGIGFGTQYMMKQYQPKMLVGLDFTPQQISKAEKYHKDVLALFPHERFKFMVGDATKMPFPDSSFSHVISVEAAQHFPSLEKFIEESRRVLKPEGRLTFTTFFAKSPEGRDAVKTLVPDYMTHCSDILAEDVITCLEKNLKHVKVKSIGDRVWPGLETWLKKIGYQNQWTMLWPALYKAKYIDYFIFRADAPEYRSSNSQGTMPHYKSLTK